MEKLFIEDLKIAGKKVLMRVDFNVPLNGEGNVADATRIEASLPSIHYILENGGALILMSHLGRPRNEPNPELSLAPVARALSAYLGLPVTLAPDCVGEKVREKVKALKPGQVLLLENLRFHRAEKHPDEDPLFAKELASYGDLYINDAFGSAHRKHSSTYTITSYFPGRAAAGYLMEKEIRFLSELLTKPQRPFYALLGGAKISTKIGILKSLLKKVDRLLIGGGMAYTFLKAQKTSVGDSLIDEDLIPLAKEILKDYGDKIVLPVDSICAVECNEYALTQIVKCTEGIPDGYQGFDLGPETIKLFIKILTEAKTILWNGPCGVYEIDRFALGTFSIAHSIALLEATTIVGGGDLIAAIKTAGVTDKITHISTGGAPR